jgi:hypothetical protein
MRAIQAEETITFDVEAAADDAFPLFGPKREMDWDRNWRPTFLMPPDGDQSPHGSVFLVRADDRESVWIMTVYDSAQRAVQYVRVTPGHTTGQIWISITPLTAASSQVKVTYRLTGLSPIGNQFVRHWAGQFPRMGSAWAEVINHYLRTATPHPTRTYDVQTPVPISAS